jgi:glycosyltransferase involved in cell wall biosynthesis
MRNVAIDAYHFVGMRGGSGGSGSYLFALIEHLSRLADIRVIASRQNAQLFADLAQRYKHLIVKAGGDTHSEAVRAGIDGADILYAPFTSLPAPGFEHRIPSVIAIHDLQHRFLKGCFPEPERVGRDDDFFAAASSTDGIITFSKTEQRNITEIYNVKVAVSTIPHAPFLVEDVTKDLENARIAPDRNPYIKKYGRYALYSAVNWPHKNHFRLIEAFRLIAEDSAPTDLKLILTGAACVEPREHFYKELLDQPWARDRVVDLGYVSNVQLYLLLSGAEAFVFPSMYEGFGIPVLEAMRVGTPVIASDLPVMREWFSGCYEPFHNIRDSHRIAEDLCRFLGDPQRRHHLADTGLARSLEFSSTRTAQETFRFLSEIADNFDRARHNRVRPFRDLTKVRAKDRRLLFHVLVDDVAAAGWRGATAAIEALSSDCGEHVGFVFLVPYQMRKAPLCCGDWEVLYFDEADRQRELVRAISFYAKTQADVAFHCFIKLSALAALAEDRGALVRYRDAMYRTSDGIDGFYLGADAWPATGSRILEALHVAPTRIEAAIPDGAALAIHHFILTNEFVLDSAVVDGSMPDWFGDTSAVELAALARIVAPRPRFAYIETQPSGAAGHFLSLVGDICAAAERAGLAPIVGGNRNISAEAFTKLSGGVDPCFSDYGQAPEPHVTPSHFAEELWGYLRRHHLTSRDYVYLHMPFPTLIAGILQIVATRRIDDLPFFLLRICSADETFRWHEIRETKLLEAIAQLGPRRRERLRISVESIPLSDYFAPHLGRKLPVLLNPIGPRLAIGAHRAARLRQQRCHRATVSFGYFGEAREEKGFHLLPDIIEEVVGAHGAGRVRFSIQVTAAPGNDTEAVRTARARLERIAKTWQESGTLRLYAETFRDMNAYYAALAGCDALLLPYDAGYYQFRGSGVALEALALGIPIIVPAGTDMAVTFAGAGCVVAAGNGSAQIAAACTNVIDNREALFRGLQDFLSRSTLFKSESEFINALIERGAETTPPRVLEERPVALWIGNDVLRQGCSAVYAAQRDFLRRQGFEIYNIYVPFPDLGGHRHSDAALEKYLLTNALGWSVNGYDFGCYAWTLNHADDEARRALLREINEQGPSTRRFVELFGCTRIPPALLQLVESRPVALVCVNYVHLLPIVELLGLQGRKDTRVVLETHDIQAHQYAIRSNRDIDEEDKEYELLSLTRADAVIAISHGEYEEICERNPWATVEFVLPTVHIQNDLLRGWHPGASCLSPHWLELWLEREDLIDVFDLRTPASLDAFMQWILIHGRREYPFLELEPGLLALANAPHPDFQRPRKGPGISTLAGWIWRTQGDLAARYPRATNARHRDRQGFLDWLRSEGAEEFLLEPDGSLTATGADRRGLPAVPPALLEAVVLARPAQLESAGYRARMFDWLGERGTIDVMVVGSDHPANVVSIRRFIHEVYAAQVARQGVNLLLVGRSGMALEPEDMVPGLFVLGEVDFVDPLYEVVRVVAVPTASGSGAPIKMLDALSRGLCVSVSEFVDRALDLSAYGFPLATNPRAFAADILMLLSSREARAERMALAQKFAGEQLAAAVYDAKWRSLAGLPPADLPRPEAEPATPAALATDALAA